jgi:hypothetical protein
MGVMIVGHSLLNYPNHSSIDPFFYTLKSIREVSLPLEGQTKDGMNRVEGTNMGSTNTIEDDMECPNVIYE